MSTRERPQTRIPREQIHPRIPADLRKRLRAYSGAKGASESSVVQTALTRYLDDANDGPLIMRRLDRLNRSVARAHRDTNVAADAFGVFVQLWLAHTPRIAEEEKTDAERSALARFARFVDHVAAKVAAGPPLLRELAPESMPDEADDPSAGAAGGPTRKAGRS